MSAFIVYAIGFGLVGCGYYLGKGDLKKAKVRHTEVVFDFLITEGYVRSEIRDGEHHLIKIKK